MKLGVSVSQRFKLIAKMTLATAVLAAAMIAPVQAQQARQSLSKDSVIEDIKKRGAIKIGLAEFIPTAWDGIIPALVSGKFDVIISGMTTTPQRNLTINFTNPYAYSGLTILANTKMTDGFALEDFNSEEVTFAARRGATPAALIPEMFPKATLLLFDEDGASTQEVLNGKAHATMASEPTPSTEARRYPDVLNVPFTGTFSWLEKRNDYWFRGNEWADLVPE